MTLALEILLRNEPSLDGSLSQRGACGLSVIYLLIGTFLPANVGLILSSPYNM
jgi:hypothetical protein